MSGIAAAAITAGGALLGTGASIAATGKLNKKNRQWQEDRMREQNAYNTPAAQMQRFKDAGLNPHLIYGQGTNGNQSAPTALPDQKVPDFSGIGDSAQAYVATRVQQTQMRQMEKNIEVADTEKSLKQAQEIATLMGAAKTDVEREQLIELFQLKKDGLQANLDSTVVNTELAGKQIEKVIQDISASKTGQKLSESQIQKTAQDIKESASRIKVLEAEKNYKEAETERVKLENNLRQMGLNPTDPAWTRILTQFGLKLLSGEQIGEKSETTYERVGKSWQKVKNWYTK